MKTSNSLFLQYFEIHVLMSETLIEMFFLRQQAQLNSNPNWNFTKGYKSTNLQSDSGLNYAFNSSLKFFSELHTASDIY